MDVELVAMRMPWVDSLLRLGLAGLIGVLLGLNRKLHDKPIGVRTLSLVTIGCCVLTLAMRDHALETGSSSAEATSRVAQGIVSGIGFLGAGVIMRSTERFQVHNLTTAATIWVSAAFGIVCALSHWPLVLMGTALTFGLLVLGEPVDRGVERLREEQEAEDDDVRSPPRRRAGRKRRSRGDHEARDE